MSESSILFVTQPQAVTPLFPALKEAGIQVGLAENLSGALSYVKKSKPRMIFSRVRLPGFHIEQLLAEMAAAGECLPIIALTDHGSSEEAARLMEQGAQDYWMEPLSIDKIGVLLTNSRNQAEAAGEAEQSSGACAAAEGAAIRPGSGPRKGGAGEIIGRHPAMLRVLALARQVARSRATVLISGESGTGKERFARFLHENSDRTNGPFVAINCAALPEHLLESELFGHEKGAFTGAIGRKLGKFELAAGGTILLDEISEMDLGLQAKLLRVLQEGEIDRVGGTDPVRVDTRVLATTNRRLEEYVAEGKFRQDLYYRLNVIPLKLPNLKERGEDVHLLAEHFVGNYCKSYGLPMLSFSPAAQDWLMSYDWPGNVRELQNLMERAVLLAGNGPIETGHFLLEDSDWQPDAASFEAVASMSAMGGGLPADTEAAAAMNLPDSAQPGFGAGGASPETYQMASGQVLPIAEMEKRMILKSLDHTGGNRTQAAQLLGISVRTLRNKINDYRSQGITVP